MLQEVFDPKEIKLLRMLIAKYHEQGCPAGSGLARHSRYFVWVIDGFWVAGCWIHETDPFFNIAVKFNIPKDNTYFIRRICRFAPLDCLIDFLNALCGRLRDEGKECIWTLGLTDHSNAIYRRAGFKEVGITPRTKHPVFVKWLR